MNNASTLKSFTDIDGWKYGHRLVLEIYKITREFPKDEKFCLVDQMRRCSISITSNIAEGFSRKSYKEKIQFYSISLGSVTELQNQLLIARDLRYINSDIFNDLAEKTVVIHKLINGLIKGARRYTS